MALAPSNAASDIPMPCGINLAKASTAASKPGRVVLSGSYLPKSSMLENKDKAASGLAK